MSEISLYEAQKKKMQGLCDEHELVYRFRKDAYPISFTISPMQGMDAQLSMLENTDKVGYRSPEATMTWIFKDGVLETKVQGGIFTISKTLRTKIESVLVKMITYWQQYFFRDIMEKGALKPGFMPVINEDETNDLPDGAEPLDEYEDELLSDGEPMEDDDPLIADAVKLVRAENKATTSLLQRRLNIGYSDSARLMDKLEELGVVGEYNGGEPREVLPYDEPDDADAPEDEADE